jgi:hypothetical protein
MAKTPVAITGIHLQVMSRTPMDCHQAQARRGHFNTISHLLESLFHIPFGSEQYKGFLPSVNPEGLQEIHTEAEQMPMETTNGTCCG